MQLKPATAQVLGSFIALFGVFVLFKIKSIKDELIGIANSYITKREEYGKLSIERFLILEDERELFIKIQALDYSGIYEILVNKALINKDMVEDEKKIKTSLELSTSYKKNYSLLRKIIKKTKRASIFTAIFIGISLAIIPFGPSIISCPVLLYGLFIAFVLAIIKTLYLFIKILKISLRISK